MFGTDARRIFADRGHEVIATDVGPAATGDIRSVDITDFAAIRAAVQAAKPDLVLHPAAYTNVDGCERDPDTAYKVNAVGTWNVAAAAEEIGAALVAISTDFVFDGEKGSPYTEFDTPNPISHYGASKLAGENLARQACRRTYIVRTSWLYGVHGKNFPYTVLKLAKAKSELPIVGDQVGTPMYTVDLVNTILTIIETPQYGLGRLRPNGPAEDRPGKRPGARHHQRRIRPDVRLADKTASPQRDASLRPGTPGPRYPAPLARCPRRLSGLRQSRRQNLAKHNNAPSPLCGANSA
jgi:dTDP-4-dehydrorhamnose reductase